MMTHVERGETMHFALLRTPAEGLPAAMQRILHGPRFDMNASLAQRVPVNTKGRFWVIPGRGVLCIFAEQDTQFVSSVCAKTAQALVHGLAITLLSRATGGGRTIVGIAPDGKRTAVLHSKHATIVAQIVHNVFADSDSLTVPVDRVDMR
jgi:hypothetical protein